MKFKVTTNGGFLLIATTKLENVQAIILATRTIPVYVRTNTDVQAGWVFECIGPSIIFTWHGQIQTDEQAEIWAPWMLTLRRAIERALNPSPSKEPSND